jgi:hypothetical protein
MTVDGHDVELFRHLEQQLHRLEIRSSREAVNALLADDFMEFSSSGGVYDKTVVVDVLAQEASSEAGILPEVYDFPVKPIAPEAVLVTYRNVRHSDGVTPERRALRSSIWKLIDGRWQMLFHQGTIVPGLLRNPPPRRRNECKR